MIKENDLLKDKNQNLKIELNEVKPFVDKFIFYSQKLNLILNNQKAVFDKTGLDFKSYVKQ